MSREPKRMEENMRGSSKVIVYIAVAAAIAIAIVSYVIISNTIKNNEEEKRLAEIKSYEEELAEQGDLVAEAENTEDKNDAESVSTQMGKTVEESAEENKKEEGSIASSTSTQEENMVIEDDDNKNTSKSNSNEIDNTKEEKQEENKEITFAMPGDGEIVRGYAKAHLVYSETLQEWIVHQAIDIKANSRDVVKASAEGIVSAIKNDPRYGLTVIIEHEGGFKTVYSNLLTAEFVIEGEKVKQGQTLGTVGSSATFEIADEPHLHFEMLKDSVYVDPTIYIK